MGTEIIRKESIEELCGHRARALELYAQAAETLQEAVAAHGRACYGNGYVSPFDNDILRFYRKDDAQRWQKHIRELVDRNMWYSFIHRTPFGALMDQEARAQFEEGLKKDPPEATPETVAATLRGLAGDADLIFRRGLVNVFRSLSQEYRSHDGFKIGDRVVIEYGVDVTVWRNDRRGPPSYSFNFGYGARHDSVLDLDRVFHVLDGKVAPDYQQGLGAAIRETMARRDGTMQCESDYFRARWFKNRALHLWMKRADLVERANRLIAEHFGETLGAGPDVAQQRRNAA